MLAFITQMSKKQVATRKKKTDKQNEGMMKDYKLTFIVTPIDSIR